MILFCLYLPNKGPSYQFSQKNENRPPLVDIQRICKNFRVCETWPTLPHAQKLILLHGIIAVTPKKTDYKSFPKNLLFYCLQFLINRLSTKKRKDSYYYLCPNSGRLRQFDTYHILLVLREAAKKKLFF